MVIPAGKKFKLVSRLQGDLSELSSTPFSNQDSSFYIPKPELAEVRVPRPGYKGNAYLGQDISLNFASEYTNPLEGIFGSIPSTVDFIGQAVTGVSLRANKLSALKYWVNTSPLALDIQLVFETQYDPFYDVFLPIFNLLLLILPSETAAGFFIPPVATVKNITDAAVKLAKASPTVSGTALGQEISTQGAKDFIVGALDALDKKVIVTGYSTDLALGENITLENVLIKSVTPNFSSETCYAPLFFLNGNKYPSTFVNPLTASEAVLKLLSQSVCAFLAGANNTVNIAQSVASFISGTPQEELKRLVASFPIRCEVNMSLEVQFPISKQTLTKVMSPNSTAESDSVGKLFSKK